MTAIYLTASQVAERLQVSVSWVYKHKHLLGAVRVGERMWRLPEQQLTAHLASGSPAVRRRARRQPDSEGGARKWPHVVFGSRQADSLSRSPSSLVVSPRSAAVSRPRSTCLSTWAYTIMVMTGLACPRRAETAIIGTRSASSQVACECRRS